MSDTNILRVERAVRNYLQDAWSGLTFKFESEKDEFRAVADLTLKRLDADVTLIIAVYEGGMASCTAVFDKINKTTEVFNLINDFNASKPYFQTYIRNDGYLVLRNMFGIYGGEETVADHVGEFMSRLAKLPDDRGMQALARLTI